MEPSPDLLGMSIKRKFNLVIQLRNADIRGRKVRIFLT